MSSIAINFASLYFVPTQSHRRPCKHQAYPKSPQTPDSRTSHRTISEVWSWRLVMCGPTTPQLFIARSANSSLSPTPCRSLYIYIYRLMYVNSPAGWKRRVERLLIFMWVDPNENVQSAIDNNWCFFAQCSVLIRRPCRCSNLLVATSPWWTPIHCDSDGGKVVPTALSAKA